MMSLKHLVLLTLSVSQALICISLAQSQPTSVFGPQNGVLAFAADRATKETYKAFMSSMREELDPKDNPSGIKVLQDPSTFPENRRFFEVELTTRGNSISLGIDKTNVYIVAYKAGQNSYFLKDEKSYVDMMKKYLFTNTKNKIDLKFGGAYGDLPNRETIYLGFNELQEAIRVISSSSDPNSHKKSLVVIIQMVSEAVRYYTIEYFLIARSIVDVEHYNRFYPFPVMLDLENNWGALSNRVQRSTDGLINPAVPITDLQGKKTTISRVDQIIRQLAVMKFECTPPSSTLMPITTFKGISNYLQMVTLKTMCTIEDVTAHIIGRDGMCVGTKNRKNDDGTPLQLQPCAQHDSQKWTLRRDKTIQSSQGKCIIASGFTPGQQAQILNCRTAANDAKLWNLRRDGTISSANRPVVLSAEGSSKEITLTMETDRKTTYQGWQPNTNLQPSIVSIIGYNDLCLQASGSTVRIGNCGTFQNIQRWAMYGDGSIRENSNRNLCLNSNGQSSGSLVGLLQCSGSANQRWIVNGDGSIQNLISRLVIEVKNSNPALNQIVLSSFTSKPSQKWLVIL